MSFCLENGNKTNKRKVHEGSNKLSAIAMHQASIGFD